MPSAAQLLERNAGLVFCLEDEVVAGYVAGTLDATDRAWAQRHLDACSTCFRCLIDETWRVRRAAESAPARVTPRRARRAPLALVPFVGLAVMIAITGWVRASSRPELCDEPRASIERSWSADERAAFARGDAGAAWVVQIDRYTDAWAHASEHSCTAVRPGTPADDALHGELACLAEQRVRLESFIDAAGSATDVGVLFEGALALPPVGACRPDVRGDAERAEIRRELAHHEGLVLAGAYAEAIAGLELLIARAQDDRALEVELMIALGRAQASAGELAQAAGTLLAASNVAEAGRADAGVADALLALVEVTTSRGELVRAREYAERTAAAIERIGSDDRRRTGALVLARARIELVAGNHAAAQLGMRAALGELSADDPQWVVALEGLASTQAALADHRAARLTAQRVVETRVEALGQYHPRVAAARFVLAREQLAAGERDAALREIDAALPLASDTAGPRSTTVAQLLDLRGELLRALGRTSEAIEHFRRARRMLIERVGEHDELVAATERHEALAVGG